MAQQKPQKPNRLSGLKERGGKLGGRVQNLLRGRAARKPPLTPKPAKVPRSPKPKPVPTAAPIPVAAQLPGTPVPAQKSGFNMGTMVSDPEMAMEDILAAESPTRQWADWYGKDKTALDPTSHPGNKPGSGVSQYHVMYDDMDEAVSPAADLERLAMMTRPVNSRLPEAEFPTLVRRGDVEEGIGDSIGGVMQNVVEHGVENVSHIARSVKGEYDYYDEDTIGRNKVRPPAIPQYNMGMRKRHRGIRPRLPGMRRRF